MASALTLCAATPLRAGAAARGACPAARSLTLHPLRQTVHGEPRGGAGWV